jgi:hypothetical protein
MACRNHFKQLACGRRSALSTFLFACHKSLLDELGPEFPISLVRNFLFGLEKAAASPYRQKITVVPLQEAQLVQ